MTRILSAVIVLVVGAAAVVFAWPTLFGLARTPLIGQVVALRGLGVAVALVIVVVFTLIALLSAKARRFCASIAVVMLAFVAINAAVLSTRGFGDSAFDTATDTDVTVLAWNTLGDAPGAEAIATLAIENNATVISLPESTEELGLEIAEIMAAAGHPMSVHTVAYDQIAKARSTTLLISVSLGDYQVDSSVITTAVLPTVVATPVDGTGPTIIAVHALAPLPPMMTAWERDLAWLADACSGDNVIMAGDFNATLDHFGGLATARGAALGGCFDAALATDNAAVGTWPTRLPALLGSPIDHVMATSHWRATGMRVVESHDEFGSDHRPIIAQLTPAG
ncbi:MAG: endonuclease/exonuclease/phosphatase family protein [Rhodoglobus sp.]